MIHQFFPTLIYQAHLHTKLLKDLSVEVRQIQAADPEGALWSQKNYPLGYTSYGSLDQLHRMSSTFGQLEKALNFHVKTFAAQLDMDIRADELKMGSCWVNIMPPGAFHTMHIHPLSTISGTFYV